MRFGKIIMEVDDELQKVEIIFYGVYGCSLCVDGVCYSLF